MNFVQQLEECLRDLAAEARKKHPGVKEASERATLSLRQLQTQYVAKVRQASQSGHDHPDTSLFRSSDLLHPFLLAANYPNATPRLLELCWKAMRLLMKARAIVPSDSLFMVRVWMIQAQVVVKTYERQYAKELAKQQRHYNVKDEGDIASPATATSPNTPAPPAASSSSSWFSWGSSSHSVAATTTVSDIAESETAPRPVRNAGVSSSTGQTGQAAANPKEMERLALELLSLLLQLLEVLQDEPQALTKELWTNAVAVASLWSHYVPARHTVQQAAYSTLSQLLSVLGEQQSDLWFKTWQDLLALAGAKPEGASNLASPTLRGAFALCKGAPTLSNPSNQQSTTTPPWPPTAVRSLELMVPLWIQFQKQMGDTPASNEQSQLTHQTLQTTLALLQQNSQQQSVEKHLRVVQWSLVVIKSLLSSHPSECRELLDHLLKPIHAATESCRKHHDFEDGYVYLGNSAAPSNTRPSTATTQYCYFSTPQLWKASFCVEAIYQVLSKPGTAQLSPLLSNVTLLSNLTEALSEFATIGTSCKDHMLPLVDYGCMHMQRSASVQPTISRTAEQLLVSGGGVSTAVVVSAFGEDSTFGSDHASADGKAANQGSATVLPSTAPSILGEAMWIAFCSVLRIPDLLREIEQGHVLLESCFPPILAILQHFLKRLSGSAELADLALHGYTSLAELCLPHSLTKMTRKTLLTSLCKLSLPSWGKLDPRCQLRDHHIRCLLVLLKIVHAHPDHIVAEWDMVLWTFEELSVMPIASSQLSDDGYHSALAVSAAYTRFAPFSASLSSTSLVSLTQALADIVHSAMQNRDMVGDSDTLLPERLPSTDAIRRNSGDGEKESFGGRIMNMGVRAIYGASDTNDAHKSDDMPLTERTKQCYYEDYRRDFGSRLASSKMKIRLASIGRLPFALILLTDVAMVNTFREKEVGEKISEQLSKLAASTAPIRTYTMDIVGMIITSQVSSDISMPSPFTGPARVVFENPMQSQLLAVASTNNGKESKIDTASQAEVLIPLCSTIESAESADVAASALAVLKSVMEGSGHNFGGSIWENVVRAICSLSGDPKLEASRTNPAWSKCCLQAFECLKMVVNDFADDLQSDENIDAIRSALLDCCSSFGASLHDVNTALTAIGLVWTVAEQDKGFASVLRALSHLGVLCGDARTEVRNAAVNTLFSCIIGKGAILPPSAWESSLSNSVFGVYAVAEQNVGEGESPNASPTRGPRYSVSFHHSRDSVSKQWVTTQILVLRGILRICRSFFAQLLQTVDSNDRRPEPPWFQDAWVQILDFAFDAASQPGGRDAMDLRSTGVELLVSCAQLASVNGTRGVVTAARVSTDMEVVNGALKSVRKVSDDRPVEKLALSDAVEAIRQNLFLEAFEGIQSLEDYVKKASASTDDTLNQTLHRFVEHLSNLYDCCKEDELAEGGTPEMNSRESEQLETKFIRIISTIMEKASVDASSKYLNQAQRGAMDLLEKMANAGSVGAFRKLVALGAIAFFVRKQIDATDTSETEFEDGSSCDLLSFEASVATSKAFLNEIVQNEKRMLILYDVLSVFDRELSDSSSKSFRRLYYKRAVPILTKGLESTNQVIAAHSDADLPGRVWELFCKALTTMVDPVPLGKDLSKIARVCEVIEIIEAAKKYAPISYREQLGAILSSGAKESFRIATLHDAYATEHSDSEQGKKSRKHTDELRRLFSTCFGGACELNAGNDQLRNLGDHVLRSVTNTSPTPMQIEFASTLIKTLQDTPRSELAIIAIFPALCQLISDSNDRLKAEVSLLVSAVDVGSVLHMAQYNERQAEERAARAQARVTQLERLIEQLRRDHAELQSEAAALRATSGL